MAQHKYLLLAVTTCSTIITGLDAGPMFRSIYTVRHKNAQKLFYHSLKKGYPILIIFGMHIQFPPHRTSASALPGKIKTSKILHFYSMQYHYLIKIIHIWHIFPKFLALWLSLSNCLVVQLLTVNIRNIGHLCNQLRFEFINIFKQHRINLLLHNTANTVEWTVIRAVMYL